MEYGQLSDEKLSRTVEKLWKLAKRYPTWKSWDNIMLEMMASQDEVNKRKINIDAILSAITDDAVVEEYPQLPIQGAIKREKRDSIQKRSEQLSNIFFKREEREIRDKRRAIKREKKNMWPLEIPRMEKQVGTKSGYQWNDAIGRHISVDIPVMKRVIIPEAQLYSTKKVRRLMREEGQSIFRDAILRSQEIRPQQWAIVEYIFQHKRLIQKLKVILEAIWREARIWDTYRIEDITEYIDHLKTNDDFKIKKNINTIEEFFFKIWLHIAEFSNGRLKPDSTRAAIVAFIIDWDTTQTGDITQALDWEKLRETRNDINDFIKEFDRDTEMVDKNTKVTKIPTSTSRDKHRKPRYIWKPRWKVRAITM
jgi:hypothetical protein